MTKFEIDRNLCVGHASVTSSSPISSRATSGAHVRGDGHVLRGRIEALQRAQKVCPEGTVVLIDDQQD